VQNINWNGFVLPQPASQRANDDVASNLSSSYAQSTIAASGLGAREYCHICLNIICQASLASCDATSCSADLSSASPVFLNSSRLVSHYLASTSGPSSADVQLSLAGTGRSAALTLGQLSASLPVLQDVLVVQQEYDIFLQQAHEAYRLGDYHRALTLCQTVRPYIQDGFHPCRARLSTLGMPWLSVHEQVCWL
jgi:hypothetical protein